MRKGSNIPTDDDQTLGEDSSMTEINYETIQRTSDGLEEAKEILYTGIPFACLKITFNIIPERFGFYLSKYIPNTEIIMEDNNPIEISKFNEHFLSLFENKSWLHNNLIEEIDSKILNKIPT